MTDYTELPLSEVEMEDTEDFDLDDGGGSSLSKAMRLLQKSLDRAYLAADILSELDHDSYYTVQSITEDIEEIIRGLRSDGK